MQNFMGMDGFIWFTGVVEDRNDPSQLGRVRVRCVGHHTDDKSKIPTADLPWAHVMHPVTDPSMNGMGNTPSFMVEGTWVVGFFMDAEDKQQPVIIGTLPGVPEEFGNPNKGFSDPNRRSQDSTKSDYNVSVYPRSVGESDTNRLARNFEVRDTIVGDKKAQRLEGIRSADGTIFDEPETTYDATYPKNHVFESESGHTVEYDDTPGKQRFHQYASSGSFTEIDALGNRVVKVQGDDYYLAREKSHQFIQQDMHLTVDGTLNIKCRNLNIEVDDDVTEDIGRNRVTKIEGTESLDINGEILETFNDKYTRSIHGEVDERYGDKIDRYHSGIVTNNHQANLLHFIKGGDTEFHITQSGETGGTFDIFSEISVNIDTATIDFDASSVASITSATTTINGSTASNIRGATVGIDGTTVDIDATTYNLNASSSNLVKITTGSADAHALSPSVTAPSSASITTPTEPEEEDLTDVILPEILDSEPKSSLVEGVGEDDPEDEDGNNLAPSAGRSGGAVSVGGSSPAGGNDAEAVITPPGDCTRPELGSQSARFESNGDPAAINTKTYSKDRGGWSYGSYQIATKVGAMKNFLTFLGEEHNGFTDFSRDLENAGGNTSATRGEIGFRNKWKDLATSEITATRFQKAQHDYIQRKYHDVAVRRIKETVTVNGSPLDVCDGTHSNGLQDTIWSTAVQYGPNGCRGIVKTAVAKLKSRLGKNVVITDADLINEIHDVKLNSVETRFKSSPSLWGGLRNRITEERGVALANNISPTSTSSTTVV